MPDKWQMVKRVSWFVARTSWGRRRGTDAAHINVCDLRHRGSAAGRGGGSSGGEVPFPCMASVCFYTLDPCIDPYNADGGGRDWVLAESAGFTPSTT